MEERDIKIMQESNYWHHAQVLRDEPNNGWRVQVVDRVRGERHFLETKRGSDSRVFMTADTAVRWCEKIGIEEVKVLLGDRAREELSGSSGTDDMMRHFTVLLVEDDVDDQTVVSDALSQNQDFKFRVIKERTLDDATRILNDRQLDVDVVLLDLNLPDARGLGTLEGLLSHPSHAAVIVVTGNEDESLREDCIRKGALDFVSKTGMNQEKLLKSVGFALARSKQRRVMELENLLKK